jgi:hypothetical protein
MKLLITVVFVFFSSLAAAADEFSLRLSEDSLSLILDPEASNSNSFQVAFIHNDDNKSDLLSAGLFANGSRDGFSGRLGGKAYYADLDNDSGYGVALGGEIYLPINPDLQLNTGIYYGPGSLSFSDIDGYQEFFVRMNYQVFDNTRLGVGYISLELEPEKRRDVDVDDGFFVEMNFSF